MININNKRSSFSKTSFNKIIVWLIVAAAKRFGGKKCEENDFTDNHSGTTAWRVRSIVAILPDGSDADAGRRERNSVALLIGPCRKPRSFG